MKEENRKVKIVMDFDGTLSYGRRSDGKKNSSIASLRDGGYLDEDYDRQAHALHDKYYPIEKDNTLSHLEKLAAMHEWWNVHSQLMVDKVLTKEIMERAGRSHYVQLRAGIKEFFSFLKEKDIDAYIFTAGRRDLIYYTLLEEGIDISEDHIIGNYFIYNNIGQAIDYNRPQITSMDKDESAILDESNVMYDSIRKAFTKNLGIATEDNKTQTIIIGDGEDDAHMIKDNEGESVYRIGFFNMSPDEDRYEERLAHFKSIYDVVLSADASMSEVIEIIKEKLAN